jgi:hypothetical protein
LTIWIPTTALRAVFGVHLLPTAKARLLTAAFFFKQTNNQTAKWRRAFFKNLLFLGDFQMTATVEQRQFNKYPIHAPLNPDIWHRASKHEKRASAIALTYTFLVDGGKITKCPPAKRKGGLNKIFEKEVRSKAYENWHDKFLAGDDFSDKGPRFTSKAIPETSASKRDTERKSGVSHANFSGAVIIDIAGKLKARKASHAAFEYDIDLVSDEALRASAQRGDKRSQKIVELIEDSADDVSDANRRSTISDDFNLCNVDITHNARLKLAA